jgi:hypothetical protein
MEITEATPTKFNKVDPDQQFDQHFKPKGAIAFFLLLITIGLIIWFGIYFLMLDRL